MPQLSLVIPCRNESARLPATLQAVGAWLDGRRERTEVIVVVDIFLLFWALCVVFPSQEVPVARRVH